MSKVDTTKQYEHDEVGKEIDQQLYSKQNELGLTRLPIMKNSDPAELVDIMSKLLLAIPNDRWMSLPSLKKIGAKAPITLILSWPLIQIPHKRVLNASCVLFLGKKHIPRKIFSQCLGTQT